MNNIRSYVLMLGLALVLSTSAFALETLASQLSDAASNGLAEDVERIVEQMFEKVEGFGYEKLERAICQNTSSRAASLQKMPVMLK